MMIFFFVSLLWLKPILDRLSAQTQSTLVNLWRLILGGFQHIFVFLPHSDPFLLVKNSFRHPQVSEKIVVATADTWNPASFLYLHGSRSTVQALTCLPDFVRTLMRITFLLLDNGFREIPHLSDVINALSRL